MISCLLCRKPRLKTYVGLHCQRRFTSATLSCTFCRLIVSCGLHDGLRWPGSRLVFDRERLRWRSPFRGKLTLYSRCL